jgi:hypothetical protein
MLRYACSYPDIRHYSIMAQCFFFAQSMDHPLGE